MITFQKLQQAKVMITQLDDYSYFKEVYRLIALDLSKKQKLDDDIQKQYNKLILLKSK